MVELLLCYGADKKAVMGVPATTTPQDLAKETDQVEIEQLLITHDINTINHKLQCYQKALSS